MSKEQLRKEITELINTIKEHSDNLTGKEPMSQLELEIILSKIKKLYEKSVIFNYLHVTAKVEMMVDEQTLVSEVSSYINSGSLNPPSSITGVKQESTIKEAYEEKTVKPTVSTPQNFQEKIAADINIPTKKPEVNFINSSRSSLPNFEKSMGLNDRLFFTKELFNNNSEALNDAIKMINTTSTVADAETILAELSIKHNWKNEEAVDTFTSMVKRRF